VEALRLRNQLDPKRFYRKDEGEGKGIKGLPKYFAVRLALKEKNFFWITHLPFKKKNRLVRFCLQVHPLEHPRRIISPVLNGKEH